MITAIVNATVVLPDRLVENGAILMEDGKILAAGKVLPPKDAKIVDANGLYAGPGYVDIHCHGGGKSLAQYDPEGMAAFHLKNGTTSLCPGLSYSQSREEVFGGVELIRKEMEKGDTTILGIHFEGPYTNPKYGAAAKKVWSVDKEEYTRLFQAAKGIVCQVTHAPELEGMEEFEKFVSAQGIPLAAGHTEMGPKELKRAMENGTTIITHLFDAMGCWRGNDSIHETGLIQETAAEVALAQEGLYYELIPDAKGVHVKPENLRMALRCGGVDNIILITDATIMSDEYNPADYPEDHKKSSIDLNYNDALELSGSRLTTEQAAQNMKRHTGASVFEIFKMAARNPAMAVKAYDKVGSLEVGKDANVILCDEDMVIDSIYFRGEKVAR